MNESIFERLLLVQRGGHIDCPAVPGDKGFRLEITLTPESPEALTP